jgi:hypothetical protein
MARKQQAQANQVFNESQGAFGNANQNSQSLYQSLFPQFEGEATNPQGLGPSGVASLNTAAQQSVGGSTAGAVGEGNLTAARTRNSGGLDKALDASVRSGQQTLSEDALNVQNENEMLKQQQQQSGLQGLSGLYGTNESAMLSALGLGNNSINTGVNAGNSGWFQNMLGGINALSNGGKAAASLGYQPGKP